MSINFFNYIISADFKAFHSTIYSMRYVMDHYTMLRNENTNEDTIIYYTAARTKNSTVLILYFKHNSFQLPNRANTHRQRGPVGNRDS